MSKLGLILSSVILLLSIIVHFSTFVPNFLVGMRLAAPIHFCVMACFALMIFMALPFQKSPVRQIGEGIFAYLKRASQESKALQRRKRELVPRRGRFLAGLAGIYLVFNFVMFIVLVEGGVPDKKNGEYYLHSHGQKIRNLTENEYQQMQAYVTRGFSGHWIFFSLVPVLYFAYVHPGLLHNRRGSPDAACTTNPRPTK